MSAANQALSSSSPATAGHCSAPQQQTRECHEAEASSAERSPTEALIIRKPLQRQLQRYSVWMRQRALTKAA